MDVVLNIKKRDKTFTTVVLKNTTDAKVDAYITKLSYKGAKVIGIN